MKSYRFLWGQADPALRRRIVATYAILISLNLAVWGSVLLASARYPLLLGLAPLAYGLGLRHAVDPDHIAAIDNTVRKLLHDGKRPVGVGFFFSLGHSTIVLALSVAIALSATFVRANVPQWRSIGGVVGTSVSGSFLLLIAALNVIVLLGLGRTWSRVQRGGSYDEVAVHDSLGQRGLLSRLFRPMLRLVGESWHMYPIGVLFGLGFDTATEVGILGMSATAGARSMPAWLILLLPLLFVAGMSLLDTTDGVMMLGAYGWAYINPVRKLYYTLSITLISVVIAAFIGGLEIFQVVGSSLDVHGGLVDRVEAIPMANLGYYIVGLFLASWLASMIVFKLRRLEQIDPPSKIARVHETPSA
jgi:high-affinity nickel-transport protein